MATFSITHEQRLDGVAVIQTLEPLDVAVGETVTIADCSSGFNGSQTVISTEPHAFIGVSDGGDLEFDYDVTILNQILYLNSGTDVTRSSVDPYGTLTYTQSCSWTTVANVQEWLGIASATANDTAFLTTAVNAANDWSYRRRKAAGYSDSLSTAPSRDVLLGATLLAAVWYRERGSVDSYASFSDLGNPVPVMTMGQVNRLLGINRSQVA